MTEITRRLAQSIDHTLLKPTATQEDFLKLCAEARAFQFATVCVPPSWVPFCRNQLDSSSVNVCTVIGFPFGYSTTQEKVSGITEGLRNGAKEFDTVLNIGDVLSGRWSDVALELEVLRGVAKGHVLKLILETAYLSEGDIVHTCSLAERAGLDFVKTSTGFGPFGATIHHVTLMLKSVSKKVQVKASGGIRDFAAAKEFLSLGVTRLGTSNGVAIVTGGTTFESATEY
jgi:deoxyribose-phosphate aldolase